MAWKYELDTYISPREDLENNARRFVTERGGASTAKLGEELSIEPNRTALFMKSIGAKFERERKKWFLVAPEPERHVASEQKIKCERCGQNWTLTQYFAPNAGRR